MSLLHPGLEAFLAVAEQTTVHGAARAIGLTQTGVTQRIRTLERQLGTTLFIRSRRGMHPTAEGEALFRHCVRVRDMEGEILSFLRGEGGGDIRVRLVGPSSMMRSRIIPAVNSVLQTGNYPNISVTFSLDDNVSALEHLKSGEAHLAILERHEVVRELDSKLLRPASYILVATPAWRDRVIEDVIRSERIIDFNHNDRATFDFLEKHGLLELARRERHLSNNTDALASLVIAGLGYSVLSRDFAAPLIEQGQLADILPGSSIDFEYALAWYPRHEMPRYFQALIQAIH